jgi:hypothetical protein
MEYYVLFPNHTSGMMLYRALQKENVKAVIAACAEAGKRLLRNVPPGR